MNTKKVIETAIKIQSLEDRVFEYYRFLGANKPQKEIDDQIRSAIADLEVDIEKYKKALKKEIEKL